MNSDSTGIPELKAAGAGEPSSDRSVPRPTESSDDGAAPATPEASDRRLYLAAMLHFFSDFTRHRHPDPDPGS